MKSYQLEMFATQPDLFSTPTDDVKTPTDDERRIIADGVAFLLRQPHPPRDIGQAHAVAGTAWFTLSTQKWPGTIETYMRAVAEQYERLRTFNEGWQDAQPQ